MTTINCDMTIYVYTSLDDNYYQLYYIFEKENPISEKNIKDIYLYNLVIIFLYFVQNKRN